MNSLVNYDIIVVMKQDMMIITRIKRNTDKNHTTITEHQLLQVSQEKHNPKMDFYNANPNHNTDE